MDATGLKSLSTNPDSSVHEKRMGRRKKSQETAQCAICLESGKTTKLCNRCNAPLHQACVDAYARADKRRPLPCPQKWCGGTLPAPDYVSQDGRSEEEHVEDPVTAAASQTYLTYFCQKCPSCGIHSQLRSGCSEVKCSVCGREWIFDTMMPNSPAEPPQPYPCRQCGGRYCNCERRRGRVRPTRLDLVGEIIGAAFVILCIFFISRIMYERKKSMNDSEFFDHLWKTLLFLSYPVAFGLRALWELIRY